MKSSNRKASNRKAWVATLVASMQIFLALAVAPPALAQDVDREAPVVTFEPLEQGRRGDTQVFSANVSDTVGVEAVRLFYRLDPDGTYRSVPMNVLAGTSIYSASIESIDRDVDVIQYYIEARDASGNRTVEGFAFDPLERKLVERVALSDQGAPVGGAIVTDKERIETGMSTGRKVLYGVLGIVAVGALASLASGGGGGDGGGASSGPINDQPSQVRVTVIVDPLSP